MMTCHLITHNQRITHVQVESINFKKNKDNIFVILLGHISSLSIIRDTTIEISKKVGNETIHLSFFVYRGILKIFKNQIDIITLYHDKK